MIVPRHAEVATYRGYMLLIDCNDVMAVAPNGDVACYTSMASIRRWVRRHKASQARKGEGVIAEFDCGAGEGPEITRSPVAVVQTQTNPTVDLSEGRSPVRPSSSRALVPA